MQTIEEILRQIEQDRIMQQLMMEAYFPPQMQQPQQRQPQQQSGSSMPNMNTYKQVMDRLGSGKGGAGTTVSPIASEIGAGESAAWGYPTGGESGGGGYFAPGSIGAMGSTILGTALAQGATFKYEDDIEKEFKKVFGGVGDAVNEGWKWFARGPMIQSFTSAFDAIKGLFK